MANDDILTIWEREQFTHRDQFYNEAGNFYVQDDIVSAEVHVFDENSTTENEPIYSEPLNIDETFYDTPQTSALDPAWKKDAAGYNFKWTASGEAVPLGGHTYRVEIVVYTASGSNFQEMAEHLRVFFVKTRGGRRS